MIDSGSLDRERTTRALPQLRQQILTQVAFWLPAAILAAPDRDPADCLNDHARSVLALFRAYCTPAGRRRLDVLLETDASPAKTSGSERSWLGDGRR